MEIELFFFLPQELVLKYFSSPLKIKRIKRDKNIILICIYVYNNVNVPFIFLSLFALKKSKIHLYQDDRKINILLFLYTIRSNV